MVNAELTDKEKIIDILADAFDQNLSVNYIVKNDSLRSKRIRRLMEYSFEICSKHGKVLLNDDKSACALILLARKKTSIQSLWLDLRLIFEVTGVNSIVRLLKRESLIAEQHPDGPFYYLWFIGVEPLLHGNGLGSLFMEELIDDSKTMGRPFYLETSTTKNIPWYKKLGFEIFNEIDIGYKLYFMRLN